MHETFRTEPGLKEFIMGFFSSLFGLDSSNSTSTDIETTEINPATGLLMVGGIGGVDTDGNPYGTDLDSMSGTTSSSLFDSNNDMFSSDNDITSSFNDTFSSFDDNF